ncbi:ABC transporter substrate-binding protein [Streptomyces sp. NBC_01429]|uniref:ABC transporter substrate-binding protein n=1 Tax=Streptomyces sp. NBC_01429 TaxID=2903862 RepID=UPI002E2CA7DE|nr:ABC transporter substrate-binding protein [Streptomyces sp. NBC_01429]
MREPRVPSLTRRGLLAAGGAGLGAALAACGGDRGATSGSGSTKVTGRTGPWSLTDDRGRTDKADRVPENIVAFVGTAAALHDYGVQVKGVFGPTRTANGKPDVQAGDLDTSKAKILGLAPSVALRAAGTTLPKAIQRHAELAAPLGAELRTAKVTEAKARFDSAGQDLFYVSLAKMSADTRYFEQLGVRFVRPKVDAQGFFEDLSRENVGKYDADIIMMDNRSSALRPHALKSRPTWEQLPAVKAGQVIARTTEPMFSYDKCAPILDDLAQAIETAKKVG